MGSLKVRQKCPKRNQSTKPAPAEEQIMSGGRMLFTGPDYLRDHRVKVEEEHRYIGIGTMHPDHSSELDYIMRGNPENKPRLYRKKKWLEKSDGKPVNQQAAQKICPVISMASNEENSDKQPNQKTHIFIKTHIWNHCQVQNFLYP